MHNFVFVSISDDDAVFICDRCQSELRFNLPGVGVPAATYNGDGTYNPPDNPDQWIVPCTQ